MQARIIARLAWTRPPWARDLDRVIIVAACLKASVWLQPAVFTADLGPLFNLPIVSTAGIARSPYTGFTTVALVTPRQTMLEVCMSASNRPGPFSKLVLAGLGVEGQRQLIGVISTPAADTYRYRVSACTTGKILQL